MAQMLNKFLFSVLFLIYLGGLLSAQGSRLDFTSSDYKDPEQFKNFNKRRHVIAVWQINELKKGALVVRLKTNKLLIEQLKKSDRPELAQEKLLEQYAINKNTMMAYLDKFTFCKLYFIYSNSSDSLQNGSRSGIFLDTNLRIDNNIELHEPFYMLAERDYAYNSSIGFIKEDSAKYIKERGNAVRQMAVVIKNKYGHQLVSPFPYLIKEKNFTDATLNFSITVKQSAKGPEIAYTVDKTYFEDITLDPNNKTKRTVKETETVKIVKLQKQFIYEKIAIAIDDLDAQLKRFYQASPNIEVNKLDKKFIPYLY